MFLCGCVRQAMLRLSKDYHERVVEEEGKTQVSTRVPTRTETHSTYRADDLPKAHLRVFSKRQAAPTCARAVMIIAWSVRVCTFGPLFSKS